jgi:hypothetical protein
LKTFDSNILKTRVLTIKKIGKKHEKKENTRGEGSKKKKKRKDEKKKESTKKMAKKTTWEAPVAAFQFRFWRMRSK